MDHWKIFIDSIKLWWNNKYLWLIGIIGVLLGSSSSSSYSNLSNNVKGDQLQKVMDAVKLIPTFVWIILAIVIIVFSIAMTLLSIYLKSRSNAALIKSTSEISKGAQLNFKKSWAIGKPYYGTLFKQQLLIAIPGFIFGFLLIAVALILIITTTGSVNSTNLSLIWGIFALVGCSMILLLVIYSLFAGIAYTFGSRISIFEDKGAVKGLKEGLNFFINNIGDIIIAWLLTILANIAVSPIMLVFGLGLGIFLIFAIIAIIAAFIMNIFFGLFLLVSLGIITSLVSACFAGPINAFTDIFWTKIYLTLSKKG